MTVILLLVLIIVCFGVVYAMSANDTRPELLVPPIMIAIVAIILLLATPVRYIETYDTVSLTKFKTDRSVTIYIDSLPNQEHAIEQTYTDALTYETFDSITNATVEVNGNVFKCLQIYTVTLNHTNSKR